MIEHTERKGKEAATQSAVEIYREIIKDNIEYNIMIHDNRFDTDRIVEILDLIFETVYTTRKKLRIVDEPISLVALANAIKTEQKGGKGKPKEEKQSIRAQLKKDAGKEKAATKKKNNDLEV